MARRPLTSDEITAALRGLQDWTLDTDGTSISRQFKFADFNAAFGFMTRIAMAAEKLDHHPQWSNVYNRVDIILTTHSAKGLSALDMTMAQWIDTYAASLLH